MRDVEDAVPYKGTGVSASLAQGRWRSRGRLPPSAVSREIDD